MISSIRQIFVRIALALIRSMSLNDHYAAPKFVAKWSRRVTGLRQAAC